MKSSTAVKPSNRIKDTPQIPNGSVAVEMKEMRIENIKLSIVGTSPLICHAWSYKAQRMILDKQMKKADTTKREAKNPVECFKDSLHRMPDKSGFGVPAISFKKALVAVANHMDLKKVDCRYAFHVMGHAGSDLLRITAPALTEPYSEWDPEYWKEIQDEAKFGASMRMDMVRIGMGTSDVRFRAQFPVWAINDIVVRYNRAVISDEQIVNLAESAGFGNGLGEWRPQKDGGFGTFENKKSD